MKNEENEVEEQNSRRRPHIFIIIMPSFVAFFIDTHTHTYTHTHPHSTDKPSFIIMDITKCMEILAGRGVCEGDHKEHHHHPPPPASSSFSPTPLGQVIDLLPPPPSFH
jgi:hypothetical protein